MNQQEMEIYIEQLEQKNKRLKDGYLHLVEIAKKMLNNDELYMDSDSLILVMQVLEVTDSMLDYEFSFDGDSTDN